MHYVADDVIALLQWGCTAAESSSKEHCLAPICYWLDSSMSLIIACAAMLAPRTPSKKLSAAIRAEGKLSNKKSLDDGSSPNKIRQSAFFIFFSNVRLSQKHRRY